MGIAPTDERIQIGAINIFRIVDGKIKERWGLTETEKLSRYLNDAFKNK